MKKSILLGIAIVSFSAFRLDAQSTGMPHYQFSSLLAGLTPKPPSSVDAAQGLSELKARNATTKNPGYWAPGKQVVQNDSLMGRKVMEAAGMLPVSGTASSQPAMPGGIDPDQLKKMDPSQQQAFAQQYMAQAMAAPHPGSVPIQENPKILPLLGKANRLSQILYTLPIDLSGGIDSLTAIFDSKHQDIENDFEAKWNQLDTEGQQGESQGMTDAQKRLTKQKDADQKSTENDCLSACCSYIANFVGRISPLLQKAETLETQLEDGKAIQSSTMQHQYSSFLSTALQPIAAVMNAAVILTRHADKWIPVPQP